MLPSLTSAAYEMHLLVGILMTVILSKMPLKYIVLIVVIVAFGKEVHDYFNHGKPDVVDIVFTVIGVVVKKWL